MSTMDHDATTEMYVTAQSAPTIRPPIYMTHMQYCSKEIPFVDHLQGHPDVDAFTRDMDEIQISMWDEERPLDIQKGMLFTGKHILQRVVKICIQKFSRIGGC